MCESRSTTFIIKVFFGIRKNGMRYRDVDPDMGDNGSNNNGCKQLI